MSCVWMLQSGDVCVLASTLCKYDLRKGDLLVLSWAIWDMLKEHVIWENKGKHY